MSHKITDGIIRKLKVKNIIELLVDRISFSELQSLLLKVFELKVAKKNSSDLLKEFEANRFTKPSDIDPIIHRNLELGIFSLLPADVELIDLSSLTPAGTSSVLTPIHQNNVLSTIRNTEVASDTTNILALECAKRRSILLKTDPRCTDTIKLCSSQRVTRGQAFDNDYFSAHFNVVAFCTAGKDEGNDRFESANLEEHIRFHISILDRFVDPAELKKIIIKFYSYTGSDDSKLIENIKEKLGHNGRILFRIEENSEFGRTYYSRLRFMISAVNQADHEFDCIDGGFTDWTSKLLSNKKESLLTSGLGTDYLVRALKIKTITRTGNM